jgi:hypothetical protein
MKNKAKRLEKSVWRLQALLYDFASELEDKAARAKSPEQRAKFEAAAQHASNAGFEMDAPQQELKYIFD